MTYRRAPIDMAAFTAAEERLIEACQRDGEAWFVPSQTRMVRRLLRTGVLSCIPKVTRYNPLRGSTERRVTLKDGGVSGPRG